MATPGEGQRGQTETIGVVLLLSLSVIGATVAVAFGSVALDAAKQSSQDDAVGHAMAQFDSRAAIAALGEADSQSMRLSSGGSGTYTVKENAGWIRVKHVNFTTNSNATIYNGTLGKLVFENGEGTEIAYQGGGVWRGSGTNVTMVSPPEFHYRSATLTLPVIQTRGNASASGSVRATVSKTVATNRFYPNGSRTYPNGDGFLNPVTNGTVIVTVHSQYYRAWADYFRERTTGEVTVNETARTASLELISQGEFGPFGMPSEGNALAVSGLAGGHAVSNYTVVLIDDQGDSANFNNLQWSMYADEGAQELELHLRKQSGPTCGGDVKLSVYYTENNGADYEGWVNDTAYTVECGDFDGDGSDERRVVANFTDTFAIEYTSLDGDDGLHFNAAGSTLVSPANFDEHSGTVSWEPETFSPGSTTSLDNVTKHYLSLLGPNFDLVVEDKSGNTVNEDASDGTLAASSGGSQFITFLHITENRVKIELD